MPLERVHGLVEPSGLYQDMVYGPNFVNHLVLKEKRTCLTLAGALEGVSGPWRVSTQLGA